MDEYKYMAQKEYQEYMEFHKVFRHLRARTAPYYKATDDETIKTVSEITAFLNRADANYCGYKDNLRANSPHAQHYTPQQLIERARGYLAALERGEFPLSGGNRSVLGVAVSVDLYHWEDAGCFQMQHLPPVSESPFILKRNGIFYILCMGEIFTNDGKDLIGGWQLFDNNGVKISQGCPEIFDYKGKSYLAIVNYRGLSEQYLEIRELIWNNDGSLSLGEYVK